MGRGSIRSDAGVEMYLMAPQTLGLIVQPGQQRLCVPLEARSGTEPIRR